MPITKNNVQDERNKRCTCAQLSILHVPWTVNPKLEFESFICYERFTCISSVDANINIPHSPDISYLYLFFRGNPAAFLMAISPSANHLLALTNCTTLMPCLTNMTGRLIPTITQGQKESILFARASSNAAALYGFKRRDAAGEPGFPGWSVVAALPSLLTWSRDGERYGEENDRR